jgi:hypothetical protein
MAIVFGILLVVAGAVLVWGVDRTVGGVETSTVGVVLIAVGGIGTIASVLLAARAAPRRGAGERRDSLSPVEVEARQDEETSPFGHR